MSILQEYEEIREEMGHEKYDAIDKYLDEICPQSKYEEYDKESRELLKLSGEQWIDKDKELKEKYGIVLLSDVLYKQEEWEKYDRWFNEKYKHRKVKILGIWKSDFDDVRCNAILYQKGKQISNIIVSYEKNDLKDLDDKNKEKVFETLIYEEFEKYTSLPKISKCSKLLQEIYDFVCESDSSMCHITDEDWKEMYSDRYNDNDIEKLKEEIKRYKLEDIIGLNESEYKIIGYGNLETKFNDDRKMTRSKKYER